MRYIKYFLLAVSIVFLTTNISYAYSPPPATNLFALLSPRLIITLPIASVETPKAMMIDTSLIEGLSSTDKVHSSKDGKYKVYSSIVGSNKNTHYRLLVMGNPSKGFVDKSDFQSDVKLVFNDNSFKDNNYPNTQTFLEDFRKSFSDYEITDPLTTYPGDGSCNQVSSKPISMCLAIDSSFYVKGKKTISRQIQKVSLNLITIKGNVAANGDINNFSIDTDALAVSKTGAVNVRGGTPLSKYQSLDTAVLDQMKNTVNQQIAIATTFTNNNISSINLNSPSNDISGNALPTSSSSPPEGKLWYYNGAKLTISGEIKGSGTIIVKDGTEVDVDERAFCQNDTTRFSIIGNGTFNITPANNVASNLCGVFVNFSDKRIDINFPPTPKDVVFNAIIVSKGGINLPNTDSLTGNFTINYYTAQPTALIAQILKIAGLTTSQ